MARQDVRRAHHSENFIGIQRFYMRTFDTFTEICALFKVGVIDQFEYCTECLMYKVINNKSFIWSTKENKSRFVLAKLSKRY